MGEFCAQRKPMKHRKKMPTAELIAQKVAHMPAIVTAWRERGPRGLCVGCTCFEAH
eukprot:CAMPEP_0179328820 /NCGR_PEP_ID=MMETSP0797-20121207/62755_1 /TAXON_ID=47934 /ORGANISM="Dinophysis acuminata, Strain DAEP01" /LENGTH=55 /DNA_ID=CAMNT_0021041349 /DNA_START=30 /DNA_END=194 /DNA_ORIENTATION=-